MADPTSTLVSLIAIACVGRIVLSFLPPGTPGRHDFASLGATWAASHLCGGIALEVERRIFEVARIDAAPWALAAPWLIALLVRVATLPGGMVPRHEPRGERWGVGSSILIVSAFVLPFTGAVVSARAGMYTSTPSEIWPSTADQLALLLIVSFGLERARRAPHSRALVVFALAALFALHGASSFGIDAWRTALCITAGAVFAIPWLRRADRRGKALSILAFASAALVDRPSALLGVSGLIVLVWRTPAPARRTTAIASGVVLACALAASPALESMAAWTASAPIVPWMPLGSTASLAFDAALAVAVIVLVGARLSRRDPESTAVDRGSSAHLVQETRAERAALGHFLWISIVALALGAVLGAKAFPTAPLCALAAVVLMTVGLSVSRAVRDERAR